MATKGTRTHLVPPLFQQGEQAAFLRSGRSISTSSSPRDNSVAVYAIPSHHSKSPSPLERGAYPVQQDVYLTSLDETPSSERRLFITDTSVIFAAFKNFVNIIRKQDLNLDQTDEDRMTIRKLALDYVNFIKECWIHASTVSQPEGAVRFSSDHYRSLYTCFSLFVVLYLPKPDLEDAPVGDELMEWLNTHFIEPSTEEGDLLSSLENPWEDENFWPYLTRTTLRGFSKATTFFLRSLSRHPSDSLQRLTESLLPLLDSHPRLRDFSAERDFVYASRRWKDKVKSIRIALDRVPEDARHDGYENWWSCLSDLIGILEGRKEVVHRVCEELGADWKEVCCAWGVFIDVRLRRQDLPEVVGHVLADLPPDPTNLEDMTHASLFSGHPDKALVAAAQLDLWLAAHMADVMGPLSLLNDGVDDESGLSVRTYYLLSYAEYLHSDPALWRITVEYMCACGDIGKERADEVLMRVPLRLGSRLPKGKDREASTATAATVVVEDDIAGVLKEVNATCFEHGREYVRRVVCRIAAQTLVQQRQYGLAVSYCRSAEDWLGLGHIVDHVLEEYIENGPARFVSLVADIAPSLQELRAQPGSHGIFIHRLMFAVRYAEFHRRRLNNDLEEAAFDLIAMFHEEVAPKAWWCVLLEDARELLQYQEHMLFSASGICGMLQRLHEVDIRAAQGSRQDYLTILSRLMKSGGEKEALRRLDAVRLALARYFARCSVNVVGGKDSVPAFFGHVAVAEHLS